jgi:chromosome segregation protein
VLARLTNTAEEKNGDEVGMFSRELGRLEGEQGILERQLRERANTSARKHVAFADIEQLAEEVEKETLVERIKEQVRAFVAKYRSAPAAGVEGLEKRLVVVKKERQMLEEKIKQAEAAARARQSAGEERFHLLTRKAELEVIVRDESARRAALEHREIDFKRELGEAAALCGRSAVEYEKGVAAVEEREQDERRRDIERLKIRLEEAGGGGALEVQKEFSDALARDEFLAKELADLEQGAVSLESLIKELGETLDREFHEGLERINTEFGKFFSVMFGGGTARVREEKVVRRRREGVRENIDEHAAFEAALAAEEEEAAAGVEVEVSIPRKKIKGLAMLSGGERALTSIALIFALSSVKPPPFIVLDETDAALDEANSKRYGDMIEGLAKHSQLILITHNRETMSRAGVLYGITMERGASRLLSIAFDDALAVAK